MGTNNIDNKIKEKFENRTFKPSASAWERLSMQLDEQPKKKKFGWFFYISVAASILLLVTVGIQLISNNDEVIIPKNEIVIENLDKKVFEYQIEKLKNEVPVEAVYVKKEDKTINHNQSIQNQIIAKTIKKSVSNQNKISTKLVQKEEFKIAKGNTNKIEISPSKIEKSKIDGFPEFKLLKQNTNSAIKINADDLLYAVTHSPNEVKIYYAKHNVTREDVLKTINNELKKSNLKVNPNTILAEVESTIMEEDFQNNFLKSLKRRVSDIALVIASRND